MKNRRLSEIARNFNWPVGGFIIAHHLAILIGLPCYLLYASPRLGTIIASVVLLFLTEIGIGAAYHRFYAHRCYELSPFAEGPLLFLATLATQGSALRWSCDHRLHHTYVDTDEDPYCICKGFWYAHVLWLFQKGKPLGLKRVPDLLRNPLVVFQHQWATTLSFASNALVCALVGWATGDWLGAFVLAWWTRLLISYHLTWFVNSLAHYWGEQTYSREFSAVDNYVLAFLTVGEGYHNYHHTFAADYRNGVRWYHFDPVKWTVWTLSKLGLAWNLRRFQDHKIRIRLLNEDRKLLLESLKQHAHQKKVEIEQHIERLASNINAKLTQIGVLTEQIKTLKERRDERAARRAVRREMRELRSSMRHDWRAWHRLCRSVLGRRLVAA